MLTLTAFLVFSSWIFAANQPPVPLRWTQGAANSTVSSSSDGHTYYTLSHGDFDVTLTVDNQELEKLNRRVVPMVGVMLTFNYKGKGELEIAQHRFTLEFTKHFQVVQSSLDPDQMLAHLEEDVEELNHQYKHHAGKHPEQQDHQGSELQARIKDCMDMMIFVSTRALRPEALNGATSVGGWVFFSTKNRWIGAWRRPEPFILRLPVENVIVEFPFELPPKEAKPELRLRP